MEISHETADAILRDNLREHIAMLSEWNEHKDQLMQEGVDMEPHHREDYMNNMIAIRHMTYVLEYFGGDL